MNLIVDRTIQMKDYCNIYIKLHFIQCECTLRVSSTKLVSDMLVWKYVSTSSFSFTSSTIMSLPLRISLSLSFSLLQIQNRGFFFTTQQKLFFILAWEKTADFSLQIHFSYSAVLLVFTGSYLSFIECLDDLVVTIVFTWNSPGH